jgi:hypothetical protein
MAARSSSERSFQARMPVPARPDRTIRTTSSSRQRLPAGTEAKETMPSRRSRGGGSMPTACGPRPSPSAPWHGRQARM